MCRTPDSTAVVARDALLTADPTRLPRSLAVTSELPWPLNSGGHIRSFHLLKALAAGTLLEFVCPVRRDQAEDVEALRARGIPVSAVPVGPRTLSGEGRRMLGAALRREPYVMYRRHAWPPVIDAWVSKVREGKPDVLYFDHLDSLLYRQFAPQVPSVIDLHNVYSLLTQRTAEEEVNWLKRAFLRRQARLLAAMESRAARDCTALLAVSQQEAEHFRSLGAKSVHTVPNGVDYPALADLPDRRPADPPVVLFLGTMSWRPNAAAASFLATGVMPQLRVRFPSARLLVVGRDPPQDLKALSGANGVEVTGGVPDVKPYLLEASVMAVPLDTGGGTRLKILEAFAAGLPVVSTSVGAEGIDATPGRHLILAERPAFAAALVNLLSSPDAAASMAAAARLLARDVYDWQRIGRAAAEVVRRVAEVGP